MIEYIEEDIKEVMEITGLDKVKAENFLEKVLDNLQDLCYNNYRKRGKAYDRIH